MKLLFLCLVSQVALLPAFITDSLSASEPVSSPEKLLENFSKGWKESDWTAGGRSRRQGYMRPLNDAGWQLRMKTIHSLVVLGKKSIPALLKTLKSENDTLRILAAQTLGYLSDVPREPLLKLAKQDPNPVVRLYAVDALGMQGNSNSHVDWATLRKVEKNRDVIKHIGYAMQRKQQAVESSIIETLTKWNPQAINTAAVGKKAPDFELTSATGEKIRLSDYRGKKSVVLVFIYGDT